MVATYVFGIKSVGMSNEVSPLELVFNEYSELFNSIKIFSPDKKLLSLSVNVTTRFLGTP